MQIEICEKPDRKNLPRKIVELWKQPNQCGNGVWLFLGDNGIIYHLGKYSEFLGLWRRSLHLRINKFGKDEPRILLRHFKKQGKCGKHGNAEWQRMKDTPRDYKLNKLKSGTLEKDIPCPPAYHGKPRFADPEPETTPIKHPISRSECRKGLLQIEKYLKRVAA